MKGIRYRTRKSGLEKITVSLKWIKRKMDTGVCAVTGIPFEYGQGSGRDKTNPYTPSADRINPTKGYTKENTQIVVWVYNRAKGEYADSTLIRVATEFLLAKGYCIITPEELT